MVGRDQNLLSMFFLLSLLTYWLKLGSSCSLSKTLDSVWISYSEMLTPKSWKRLSKAIPYC